MDSNSNLIIAQQAMNLLHNGGFEQPADVDMKRVLAGEEVQVRPLHTTTTAVSYLITARPDEVKAEQAVVRALRETVLDTFNEAELQEMCFELGVPFENLAGDEFATKVQELVTYLQRRGQLASLVAYGRKHRPHANWPDIAAPTAVPSRDDIAVVVSLAQPALPTAAAYLDDQGVPAHFLLLTNVPAYDKTEFLDVDSDWEAIGQLFFQTMQTVRLEFSKARLHLFLAAPVALGFLLGCTWGTVYQGDCLYHLHRDEDGRSHYVQVATITRKLRE
ncbi:MAG: SAVED domain-containing protein [Ardenticatenaceae bacterium]|nr:SAVED domain-containing protein [Ardenticatenaceae bacterium]